MTNNSDKAGLQGKSRPGSELDSSYFLSSWQLSFFCLPRAWCITASIEGAGLTRTTPSDHSRRCKSPDRGLK
jgi:hypothetical protein